MHKVILLNNYQLRCQKQGPMLSNIPALMQLQHSPDIREQTEQTIPYFEETFVILPCPTSLPMWCMGALDSWICSSL